MPSDNGPPFASTGAAGLPTLSVWWLQLGIRLERIEPGEPQQNGRLERAHLTLEEIGFHAGCGPRCPAAPARPMAPRVQRGAATRGARATSVTWNMTDA